MVPYGRRYGSEAAAGYVPRMIDNLIALALWLICGAALVYGRARGPVD